jgi:deoxyhypusine synthase
MIHDYKSLFQKAALSQGAIQHIDITRFDPRPLIVSMRSMVLQDRNLSKACIIYHRMIEDENCTNILCLSGSLISAGLKKLLSI